MTNRTGPYQKDAASIAGMFDAIAPRYDALNHLLSVGLDRRWRARAIQALALTGSETVLDLCTGTADLALAAVRRPGGSAARVVGVDFADRMLREGQAKLRRPPRRRPVHLVRGDAMHIPLPSGSIDAVTIGFGIRNVDDPSTVCGEIWRVLRSGGRLAILEFGLPSLPGVRGLYRWYFSRVLPCIGRVVSRHPDAYSYLPASVGTFLSPDAFSCVLRDAGFRDVRNTPLTLGAVHLHSAAKR